MWILGFLLLFCALPSLEAQSASPASEENPGPPPPQPIPFSHKVHLKLGINCLNCHTIAAPGFEAGFPPDSQCMLCHASVKKESQAIQKLAAHEASGKPLEWARIYTLPKFVWFSHESHHQDAGLGCEHCHGPVSERDLIVVSDHRKTYFFGLSPTGHRSRQPRLWRGIGGNGSVQRLNRPQIEHRQRVGERRGAGELIVPPP